jgi:hypothetical protein
MTGTSGFQPDMNNAQWATAAPLLHRQDLTVALAPPVPIRDELET